jgi:hypothetical protein
MRTNFTAKQLSIQPTISTAERRADDAAHGCTQRTAQQGANGAPLRHPQRSPQCAALLSPYTAALLYPHAAAQHTALRRA